MDEALARQIQTMADTLQQQVAAHEQLLSLIEQQREALREADPDALATLSEAENEQVRAIGELEKQRAELALNLTRAVEPGAATPLGLAELAERLEEPARGRLLEQRHRLRGRMEQVRDRGEIARRATESLSRHVSGLVRSVAMVAGGGSTYGDRGPTTPATVRTINMTA